MQIANSMNNLGTETAFEVLAKAKALEAQGKPMIHLEIGEPDFDTPRNIIDSAVNALQTGWTHYGPSAGLPEHKDAIARYINKTRDVDYNSDNVVVTPGAKPIIFFGMMATINPGDEVIYPNPGFPIYESVINFLGAKPVPIPLLEEKEFSFDIEEFKELVSDKTKMIVINSPQNPTGGVLPESDLKAIADIALEKNIWVMSDEVYSQMVYDGEHHSITKYDGMLDKTIMIEGYSKTYAMTGWRMGYGMMPETLAPHVTRLMTNSNSCTSSFSQIAGIEALEGDQTESKKMIEEFKRRRDIFIRGLNSIDGFSCKTPKGAFYAFANVKDIDMTEQELSDFLMNEAGVSCLPGTSFGEYGKGYLRFSYANSEKNLMQAIQNIKESLGKR